MPRLLHKDKPGLPIVLALSLAVSLLLAWLPVIILLQKTIPDDAFYYFAIARNVAAGHGPTVDGNTLTNGFHPLWAGVLTPIFASFAQQLNLPIHLGLSLGVTFNVLAAWLAYATVRAATGNSRAALFACVLYAFNPRAIMESLNGLETGLNTFFFALFLYWYYRQVFRKPDAPLRVSITLGVFGGLLVLARTDSIFLVAITLLFMLAEVRRTGWRPIMVCGVTFSLVILPWLLWSYATFGTVIQSSGVAVALMVHEYFPLFVNDRELFALVWNRVLWPVILITAQLVWHYAGVVCTVMLISPICRRLVRAWVGERKPRHDVPLLPAPLFLPLAAALVLIAFHSFYRWYPRNWYFVPLAYAIPLLAGPVLAGVSRAMPPQAGQRFQRMVVAGAVLVLMAQGLREWKGGLVYPWQIDMYWGARWLAENTAPDTVVGAFNAGVYGYYSQRPVVALDGVTNWDALRALRAGKLLAYMDAQDVTYLIDFERYITDINRGSFGPGYPERFKLVVTFPPTQPDFGTVVIFEVKPK